MRSASRAPLILAPCAQAALSLVGLISLGLMPGAHLWAQTLPAAGGEAPFGPVLQSTPLLAEKPPAGRGNELPTFVFGDAITGRPDLETVIEGHAELRRGGTVLRADRVDYFAPDDLLKTRGNVRISNAGNQFWGPALELRLGSFEGTFDQPNYRFAGGGNGQALRIDFLDNKRLVARQARYTTCERDNEASWAPSWELRGERFYFDFEQEVGEATGATLRFQDVPLLHWPGTLSFPLSDKRRSGVLPPTYAVDTTSGVSLTLPYYLDIAPNRDATLSPTYMSKRGINLASEFRYLEPSHAGTWRWDFMPGDALRDRDRWSYGVQQTATLGTGWPGVGNVALGLNLNRVSDDNYWRDFSGAGSNSNSLTPRLLANEANLSAGQGNFRGGLRILKWQTLQDVSSPIVPPYDRLPQITARYGRSNVPLAGLSGVDWSIEGDFTQFSAVGNLSQPNAQRSVARAQISHPWLWPAGFITPKLQLHASAYQFDSPLTDAGAPGAVSASRTVPTFSLDTGLQFERDTAFLGRNYTQTLEPRAFYVRTPYRSQNYLPNYDSADNSFNFATVFTENAFVGNDRISDANLLTLGLSSRLLDSGSGAEAARFGIAQRLRFQDQLVTLPGGAAVTDRVSDVLLGGSINWTREWSLDGTTQYNPKLGESERSTLGGRYSPGLYRVVSAAYRRQRELSEQIDVGWQWPVNDLWGDRGQDLGPGRGLGGGRWYSVGRLNYSMFEHQLVDSVMGFEYDGCCWIGRLVLQRSQSGVNAANTKIMFQLEFVGFSRIGNNPLSTLSSNIPKYQYLRGQVSPPSRFTNYD